MTSKTWLFPLAYSMGVLTLVALTPAPARADFFDDARRTFTTDIPHFFQDDVPCAFGGRPTSGTRSSCRGGARTAADKGHHASGGAVQKPEPDNPAQPDNPPPASGQ